MHVMIDTAFTLLVRVLFLWREDKVRFKVWVPKQRLYTCDNVPIVELANLATNNDLFACKSWPTGEVIVDNLIQLVGGAEG